MKMIEDMTEPEIRDVCNTLAKGIEFIAERLGVEKPLFMLVLFNDPKIAQYVSNCNRSTAVEALRETADRLEQRETVER